MQSEGGTPVQSRSIRWREAAASLVMMTGGAFVPGVTIGMFVVAIVLIVHLVG